MDEITSRVKRENYVTIQGWMIADLNLKGNELVIYAIIYGFSQIENQSFTGGRKYLADWTNSTTRGIDKCLKSLCEKGLIDRQEAYRNGVRCVDYRAAMTGEQSSRGVANKVPRGSEQSSSNTLYISNTYSNDNKKEDNAGAPAPAPSPTKQTKVSKEKVNTEEIFARYTQEEKVLSLLREWLKVRKAKRAPETEKALTLNLDKLEGLALQSGMNKAEYLEAVIARGWAAFYPLGDWNRPTRMPARPPVKTEAQHAAGGHQSGFGW